MPAETEKQAIAMRIAKHHPEKLYKRNRGMLKMSKSQLSEFEHVSKSGSPPFTDAEMAQGYRKLGPGRPRENHNSGIVEASPKNMPLLAMGGITLVGK